MACLAVCDKEGIGQRWLSDEEEEEVDLSRRFPLCFLALSVRLDSYALRIAHQRHRKRASSLCGWRSSPWPRQDSARTVHPRLYLGLSNR